MHNPIDVVASATRCGIFENEHGYLVWRQGSGNTIEIFEIEVDDDHRQQGHGTNLIEQLEEYGRKNHYLMMWAITRHSNRPARAFYDNTGFSILAAPLTFYKDEQSIAGKRAPEAIIYGRPIS